MVRLLGDGATVPFIARYRKEATGGLDEVQIRAIADRHEYLVELDARRRSVEGELEKQGKLTPELLSRLRAAKTKAELEDLYLPYKPKRRTRGVIAIERGLTPLAELMWSDAGNEAPEVAARRFVNPDKEIPDPATALAGARDICAERLAEDAELRQLLRSAYMRDAVISVKKKKSHANAPTKFDMYSSFQERVATLPSHRFLAIRRGEDEGVLRSTIELELGPYVVRARGRIPAKKGARWEPELNLVVSDALERLLAPAVSADVRAELKSRSEARAIEVFGEEPARAPAGGTVRGQGGARHRSWSAHGLQVRRGRHDRQASGARYDLPGARPPPCSSRRKHTLRRLYKRHAIARRRGRQRHTWPRDRGIRARSAARGRRAGQVSHA